MRNLGFVPNLIFVLWRRLIIQLCIVQEPVYAKNAFLKKIKK